MRKEMIVVIGSRACSERLGRTKCALAVCANPTTGMEVDAAALGAFVDASAWTAYTQAHGVNKIASDEAAVLDARPYVCFESGRVAAVAQRDGLEIAPEEAGHRWSPNGSVGRILDAPALAEEAKGAVGCLAD